MEETREASQILVLDSREDRKENGVEQAFIQACGKVVQDWALAGWVMRISTS